MRISKNINRQSPIVNLQKQKLRRVAAAFLSKYFRGTSYQCCFAQEINSFVVTNTFVSSLLFAATITVLSEYTFAGYGRIQEVKVKRERTHDCVHCVYNQKFLH